MDRYKNNFISVIVPSSRIETLKYTIDGLLNQTIHQNSYEIIIVTPHKRLVKTVGSSNRINIVESNKLFPPGKMRNIGANNAKGDLLFFIDDDCIPPTNWLATIGRALKKNRNVGVIGCRVIGVKKSFWYRCADYSLFSSYQYKKPYFGNVGSAAIGVKKAAFVSASGFEESLFASEDWDFSIRLKEKGWLCYFYPGVSVLHLHKKNSFYKIIQMGFLSGLRSGLYIQKKYKKESIQFSALIRFSNPLLYLFVAIPYSFLLSFMIIISFFTTDHKIILYSPIIFLSRLAYQIGVWINLIKKGTDMQCIDQVLA